MRHFDLSWLGDWNPPRSAYLVPLVLLLSAFAVWIGISLAQRPASDLKALIPMLVVVGGGCGLFVFIARASHDRAEESEQVAVTEPDSPSA